MSGIAAVATPELSPVERTWLGDARTWMSARGPDGSSAWSDRRGGLVHTLLRTSALDARGIVELEGGLRCAGDVRLDARDDLIARLRDRGEAPRRAPTDTELVLRAYAVWGEGCVEHLAGDFAFVIWDAPRAQLFCARDQFGVAPLFYATLNEGVLLSNTLACLQLHPGVADDLDDQSVADFLCFGINRDQSATTFASIRRVPPGHTLRWAGGRLTIRPYWRLPSVGPFHRFRRPEEYVERFDELFSAAVADRVRDQPVSLQLSGGMDSTSVAASARRLLDGRAPSRLLAVTIGDGEASGEESRYTRLVAESLDIPLDVFDPADYLDFEARQQWVFQTSEPVPHIRTALQLDFAVRAARHAPVALTGLGGDPLLMFVPSYWLGWLGRGRVDRVAAAFWHHVRLFRRRPPLYARAAGRYLRSRLTTRAPAIPGWLSPELVRKSDLARRSRLRQSGDAVDIEGMTHPLWSQLFGWADPGLTAMPLRYRHPFFDLRLVRFVRGLPPGSWLPRKRILREAMRGRLPESVRRRPKTPLAVDPAQTRARRHGLDTRLLTLLDDSHAVDPYLDRSALEAVSRSSGVVDDIAALRQLGHAVAFVGWRRHWRRPQVSAGTPADFAELVRAVS